MHFRLDDVHRPGAAILAAVIAIEVVDRRQVGDQAVEDAFRYFVAILVQDCVDGHQVADVAHEQQRTAVQACRTTVRRRVFTVRVHGAGECAVALLDAFRQVALHQAEPVAIDHHLVIGIDSCHGVFAIHDGGQGGFHQHILDAGRVCLADRGAGIDLDFEVQAIVLEQDGSWCRSLALVADQLCIVAQPTVAATLEGDDQLAVLNVVAGGIDMGARGQWCGFIEEGAGKGNYLVAADLVVALAFFRAACFADGVGAVQGVVQRTPACIGGVEGKTGVHDRHHQLWTRHASDFVVDVLRRYLEIRRFWQQITDFLQEGLISRCVMGLAFTRLVPGVDARLQVITFGQQGFILRSEVVDDLFRARPELLGGHAGSRDGFVIHEVVQDFGDLKATDLNVFSHCLPHSAQLFSSSI
ncbi:hypothetical protein D3C84_304740 [compost metagenome]